MSLPRLTWLQWCCSKELEEINEVAFGVGRIFFKLNEINLTGQRKKDKPFSAYSNIKEDSVTLFKKQQEEVNEGNIPVFFCKFISIL